MNIRRIALILIFPLLPLIALHLWNSQSAQRVQEAKEVSITVDGTEVTRLTWSQMEQSAQSIHATFQKKVGAPQEHTYLGIPLSDVLHQSDIALSPQQTVSVTAVDSYAVTLTPEEIDQPDNAYLVYMEDGAPLPADSAPYMLILKEDALSTRWNRSVVSIHIA